jgi:predicted nucleotidyltransferase
MPEDGPTLVPQVGRAAAQAVDPRVESLVRALRAAAATALPTLPVLFAHLYGSRTGDRARPDSDVDVGVVLDPEAGSGRR